MRFGSGKDIITPDIKMHMGGYASIFGKYMNTIHDDLYVKTFIMQDDGNTVVLISLDLIFHDYDLTLKIGEYVQDRYQICKDNVFLTYTHNHAGPVTRGYDPAQVDPKYEAFLESRIKSCVDRAFLNMFDGEIYFSSIEGNWNINRRRKENDVVVGGPNPLGIKDNKMNILKICDKNNDMRILTLNYACHPVTLGDTLDLSSEYSGRLCEILEAEFYGSTTIFFQGAGAHERPVITVVGNVFKKATFDETDDFANILANNIKKALYTDMPKKIDLSIKVKRFTIPLDIDPLSKDELRKRIEGNDKMVSRTSAYVLDRYDETDDVINLNAGIIQINKDIYIAYLCGEVCYEVKQVIENVFKEKLVLLFGYGDSTSYIPGDKILIEGGYESRGTVGGFCMKGRYKIGMDKRISDAYKKNLSDMNDNQ